MLDTMRNNAEPIKNQTKDPIKNAIEEKPKEAQRRHMDAPAEAPVKRGRGRPRMKRPRDEKIEVIGTHNKRRGRGRPRKVEKVEEEARLICGMPRTDP